jgi:hypothetical protein
MCLPKEDWHMKGRYNLPVRMLLLYMQGKASYTAVYGCYAAIPGSLSYHLANAFIGRQFSLRAVLKCMLII